MVHRRCCIIKPLKLEIAQHSIRHSAKSNLKNLVNNRSRKLLLTKRALNINRTVSRRVSFCFNASDIMLSCALLDRDFSLRLFSFAQNTFKPNGKMFIPNTKSLFMN